MKSKNQSTKNNKYPNLSLLIRLYCFKEDIINKSNEKNPIQVNDILFIKKGVLDKYKRLLGFKEFSTYLQKHQKILESIKEKNKINYSKLNDSDSILLNIINNIKDFIYIEQKNIDDINNEINKEFKNDWDYKIVECTEPKEKKLRLINDIEIINSDIINLLNNSNINLNYITPGKCILGSGKIVIFMPDYKYHIYLEIGTFINEDIKIEYLLDTNKINNLNLIKDIFETIEFIKTLKSFNKNKESIKYQNNETNEKKKEEVINFYKANENNIIEISRCCNKIINKYNNKIKSLIIISLYQNILFQNQNKEEKVFLLNKNYLDKFQYKEINTMLRKKVQNNNIIRKDKLINFFNDILIFQLDGNELKEINKKIPKNQRNNISYYPKEEEIKLLKSKLIYIYTDFILINEDIFNKYFATGFGVEIKNQNFLFNSFITINNKDIIKIINHSQFTIFIGNFNYQNYTYKIDKILDFITLKILESEFEYLKQCGIEFYCSERIISNKSSKNEDLVAPIFLGDTIIGYSYDYNPSIKDYSNLNPYLKYYKDKIICANLSLYISYFQIEEKLKKGNKTNSEKYYLINHKSFTQIRIDSKYKLIKDAIENNKIDLNNICKDKNNMKNLYSLIINCPLDLLKDYYNIKININKNALDPEIASKQYYDNKENANNTIMIYDNFEI